MKKYQIFMLGALAVGFTACEDAPADAPIQTNPQGPVLETSAVAITPDALLTSGETINLDQYVDATSLPLFTLVTDDLPEGCKLGATMEIASTEAFDDVQTVELSLEGTQFDVYPADLHDAYLDLFGFTTETKTAYYRVPVTFTTKSGAEYRLGTADYYAASGNFTESPMASIMPTDFVYTPGGSNGWSQPNSQYLFPSNNPAEKPGYFGVVVDEGGFKICEEPAWVDGKNYGFGGDGILSTAGDSDNLGKDVTGLCWVGANLEAMTYYIVKIEKVGIMGGANGWSADQYLTPDESGVVYSGDIELDGEWKVRFNDDWAYNYGGRMAMPTFDGPNFSTPKGTYHMTINFGGRAPKIKIKKI